EWWEKYYSSHIMGTPILLSRLKSGFTQPAIEKIRSKVIRGKAASSSQTHDETLAVEEDKQPEGSKPK
ncbi:hypothetical protein A2U01_0078178, partial [Trifolium medium]|nr:hypothetical protein [Trifolium medium]